MNRKRYIHNLSAEDQADLTTLLKTSRLHRERQRAQAIMWTHQGYDMESILSLLKVDRDTLSRWRPPRGLLSGRVKAWLAYETSPVMDALVGWGKK